MLGSEPTSSETALLAALRSGDEDAFCALVDAYGAAMHRLARTFVRSSAVADEVVQEAWVGALRGLDRFEGSSALKTWLLRIGGRASPGTYAVREARSVALLLTRPRPRSLGVRAGPPRRTLPRPRRTASTTLGLVPVCYGRASRDSALLSAETRKLIADTIADLPDGQRLVISLRDVEGWDSAEVCSVLELSETNQRVLLHRARAKVRAALESYLTTEAP